MISEEEPCYVISVAARMLGMHAQTLRYYERMGIIAPSRSRGRIRLYSQADIALARELLGYSASVAFYEGLGRTIDWYKSLHS